MPEELPRTLILRLLNKTILLHVSWTQMTFQKAGGETSLETEIPFCQVQELFNVNHFIVSQASPYVAPWLHFKESTRERSPLAAKVRANP